VVTRSKTLQTDGELDVAGTNNVLDLEVGELGVESELLDDTSVLARSELGIILRLGTSNNLSMLALKVKALVDARLTILPEAKIKAVVFGSRMRMMTAAKRLRRLAKGKEL